MSFSDYSEELDTLRNQISESTQSRNALANFSERGRFRSLDDFVQELSVLLKDLADYSGSKGNVYLSNKVNEIEAEAGDNIFGDEQRAKLMLGKITRAQRAIRNYSTREISTVSQSGDEHISRDEERKNSIAERSKRIFLVHGHDEAVLFQVKEMLHRVNLSPIILREQPNRGKTIIEKFEEYSDVGFAIVLMTPDDKGGSNKQLQERGLNPRARQNVVLELGYFVAKLGRERVAVLNDPKVETPSDIVGIVYTEIDESGAWKTALAKELKAANYNVDMNDMY